MFRASSILKTAGNHELSGTEYCVFRTKFLTAVNFAKAIKDRKLNGQPSRHPIMYNVYNGN